MDFRTLTAATVLIASVGGGSAVAIDRQIDPYTDRDSHLEVRLGDAQDRVRINKDRPEITLERWDGEEALTVKKSGTFEPGKRGWFSRQMVWEGEESVIVEPLTKETGGILPRARAQEATSTEEGFKIDILLAEKPATTTTAI